MKRRAFVKRMAFALSATLFMRELPRLHAEPAQLFAPRNTLQAVIDAVPPGGIVYVPPALYESDGPMVVRAPTAAGW